MVSVLWWKPLTVRKLFNNLSQEIYIVTSLLYTF